MKGDTFISKKQLGFGMELVRVYNKAGEPYSLIVSSEGDYPLEIWSCHTDHEAEMLEYFKDELNGKVPHNWANK